MTPSWWRVKMRGVLEPLMRYSRDLAQIAAVRGYGVLVRRRVDDATEWGVVSSDVSSDGDGCLVVSPCLVVTAPAGSTGPITSDVTQSGGTPLSTSQYYLRAVSGGTLRGGVRGRYLGSGPVEDPADYGVEYYGDSLAVLRSSAGVRLEGATVVVEPSGFFGLSIDGLALWTVDENTLLRATAGNVTINAGGAGGTVTLQHDGATRIAAGPDETVVRGGESVEISTVMPSGNSSVTLEAGGVTALAASGSHVLVGHGGDTVGSPALTGLGVYKPSNTARAPSTISDDPHLRVTLRAGRVYRAVCTFYYRRTSGSSTTTLRIGWSGPSGLALQWRHDGDPLSLGTAGLADLTPVDGSNRAVTMTAMVSTSGDGGDFGLQWGVASGSTVTVFGSAHLVLTDLGPA